MLEEHKSHATIRSIADKVGVAPCTVSAVLSGRARQRRVGVETEIKVLAVASKQRWPGEPNVPTMEESGFPGFVMNSWVGLLAPKGTPQPVIDKLYDILKAGAKEEDFTRTMDMLCLDTVLLEPAKARAFLQQETRRYGALVEKSGLEKQ